MKYFFIFILIVFFLKVTAQEGKVNGIVSIFNSKNRTRTRLYVENAQVKDDSGRAASTSTSNLGAFTLDYVLLGGNKTVKFKVSKPGLKVVNIDAETAVTNQNDIKSISMAPPDSITTYRFQIYQISKNAALKYLSNLENYKTEQIKNLIKKNSENHAAIHKLQLELAELKKKQPEIDAQATKLSAIYATVNLDDQDSLFNQAFRLFKNGQLDSSENLLKVRLHGMADSLLAKTKLDSLATDNCIRLLHLQANEYRVSFNYAQADSSYLQILKLPPHEIKYIFEYAEFLEWLKKTK